MNKAYLWFVLVLSLLSLNNAYAGIRGLPGVTGISAGTSGWITDAKGCSIPETTSSNATFTKNPGPCTYEGTAPWGYHLYVPKEGDLWQLGARYCFGYGPCEWAGSTGVTIWALNKRDFAPDRSIGAQEPDFGGTNETGGYGLTISMCYTISGYKSASGTEPWCGYDALPDHPSVDTCSINHDNPIDINIGEIDRADLKSTAGAGVLKHHNIPINCYSDAGNPTVPVTMQLSYTPASFAAGKVVQTSVPGLGVSIAYDSKILVPMDTLSLDLNAGANNLDFTFEAIMDSELKASDIPTGEFTASAILKITLV